MLTIRPYHLAALFVAGCTLLDGCSKGPSRKEFSAYADSLVFTTVIQNPITPVRNQGKGNTCWSYASTSFLESETMRMDPSIPVEQCPILSEDYFVFCSFIEKARLYFYEDIPSFSPRGECEDVFVLASRYGVCPENVLPSKLDHTKMDHEIVEYAKKAKKLCESDIEDKDIEDKIEDMMDGIRDILSSSIGEPPRRFEVEGVRYSPRSYMKHLGIDPSKFITLCSDTGQLYFCWTLIESPDNHFSLSAFNIDLDYMTDIIWHALEEGFTLTWLGDISENGFLKSGVALESIPPGKEEISAEERQRGIDRGKTTDDHAMHLFGIARDQNGNRYAMAKNSWGKKGRFGGVWYLSEGYLRGKTLSISLSKDFIGHWEEKSGLTDEGSRMEMTTACAEPISSR